MLKVLGLFVTMAAASLIGTYYGGLPAQRVRDLEEIKKLLTYMREEVRYAAHVFRKSCTLRQAE